MEKTTQDKPVCPKCGRMTVYFRKDGSLRCTTCNYDNKDEVKKRSE